jgi:hypothetical protein
LGEGLLFIEIDDDDIVRPVRIGGAMKPRIATSRPFSRLTLSENSSPRTLTLP